MRKILILIFLLNPFIESLYSQGLQDWQVVTYMNDITDIVYIDQQIWAGTSGGAYRFNTADSTWQRYTNLDGLKSLEIKAVTVSAYGDILFGCQDGLINLYHPELSLWLTNQDLSGQKIVDLCIDSSAVWVATNEGMGVFESASGEIQFSDFYNNFVTVPEEAFRVAVFNNHIFYATRNGLFYASADYQQENLKIASAWERITTQQGLPSDIVLDLALVDSSLYVATAAGAAWLDESFAVHQETAWGLGYVSGIVNGGDRLYFLRYNEYYEKQNGQWILGQTLDNTISCGAVDETGNLWLGLVSGGLRYQNWVQSFRLDGPGSNHVGVVIKDSGGSLWMTSGKFKLTYYEGFYQFDFKQWTNYKFSGNGWAIKNQTCSIFEDHFGKIWIGSWGGGITIISGNTYDYIQPWSTDGLLTVSTLHTEQEIVLPAVPPERRDCLVGAEVRNNDSATVITAFNEDTDNYLWIANHRARLPQYMAVIENQNSSTISPCSEWTYFGDNINMSLEDGEISCLEFETGYSSNRIWIGTWLRGILILDYGASVSDVGDDHLYRMDVSTDNLYSNTILSLKQDHDGIIWIGTSAGLNSFQNDPSGLNRRVYKHVGDIGPIENKINGIFVDAYNNKWFATDGGLSVLQSNKSPWDPSAWIHYTTANSGLPSPIVNSVFVDNRNGTAYLGTEKGLAIFEGSFSQLRADLEQVTSGPNPFLLDGSKEFVIKNLVQNASVKILNINGRLIRELNETNGDIQGSRAVWDGKDFQDRLVPSGIYLYLVFDQEGLKSSGKISVIKP
jgi:ligand-binding sensor domain-containing protein